MLREFKLLVNSSNFRVFLRALIGAVEASLHLVVLLMLNKLLFPAPWHDIRSSYPEQLRWIPWNEIRFPEMSNDFCDGVPCLWFSKSGCYGNTFGFSKRISCET